MGLSGKWLVGETEFGETSFRRGGIRRNSVGEMGVSETAIGKMGGYLIFSFFFIINTNAFFIKLFRALFKYFGQMKQTKEA